MAKIKNIDLFEFDSIVGFWQGAKTRWEEMSEDEQEYLNQLVEDYEFENLTQINDFIWFDSDELLDEYRNGE